MWVYILTNHTNSVLYTGVTNDITRRTFEHRSKAVSGFAEKYNAYKLVYVEETSSAEDAIAREKQMKMDEVVDTIRRRFGFYSIQRGLMYQDRLLSACDAKADHTVHPHGYFG